MPLTIHGHAAHREVFDHDARKPTRRAERCGMQNPMPKIEGTENAILSRIVIPFMMVSREELGGIRGLSREWCEVPFPPAARVVQTEKTEGAWIVWYVERVDAI
jgi:hypothetical protein